VEPVPQIPFDPETYLELMAAEVPDYKRLQVEVAGATAGRIVRQFLDLGVGTGMTALGVLSVHPDAQVVGIDKSADMLAYARQALPAGADLRVARIEDPLLEGPFDLVVSALAVHHLDGEGKADLFARVAWVLAPGGQFVLADIVVPDDPADVVTTIDGEYDTPSRAADQVGWMADAGLDARVVWSSKDLAVLVGDLPAG
jgi:tRNA (cmo5U34)-methyltransferase